MPESPVRKPHAHPRRKSAERQRCAESSFSAPPQPYDQADQAGARVPSQAGARVPSRTPTCGHIFPRYAELHCLTNFSFLRGASHPEELVARAAGLGYSALAITDRNSLAAVVRAHLAAKKHNLHLLIGAEITPVDTPPLVLLAPDRAAYGRLSRLITRGRRRAPKGECAIHLPDIADLAPGLIAIVLPMVAPLAHRPGAFLEVPPPLKGAPPLKGCGTDSYTTAEPLERGAPPFQGWGTDAPTTSEVGHSSFIVDCGLRIAVSSAQVSTTSEIHNQKSEIRNPSVPPCLRAFPDPLSTYREIFGDRLYLAAELAYDLPDEMRLAQLVELSQRSGIPLVAANNVHYHVPERRYLQDVLTCIRAQCTLAEAGTRLFPNAERHLRPLDEIARRYAVVPEAIARTIEIARRCTFSLDELRYEYPHELCSEGITPIEYLTKLTWEGAAERYGDRHEGTKARRHEGTKARRHKGTKARRRCSGRCPRRP